MSSSLMPSCLAALVSLLDAALAIEVFDGPVRQNLPRAALLVGATAETDGATIEFEQKWAGLGHITRDETFEIPCFLFVRDGSNELSTFRTEVFGYFATIESTLRSNPTLGISTNSIRAQITGTVYSQPRTPDGVVCSIRFTVNVEGRI